MLNVIICDDNKLQRTRIKSIIEKVIVIDNLDMSIIMDTDDPHDVINRIKTVSNTGLYFLDVKLEADISGIELAELIRGYDPRGFIVFVSGYPDNQYDVFMHRLEVMDFIDKSDYAQIRDRIENCIRTANERYVAQTKVKNDVLRFKWRDRIKSVEYKDIIYIETSGSKFDHQVVLYTPNTRYQWSSSLTTLEDGLSGDKRFKRLSQSFIVNIDYIDEFIPKTRVLKMKHSEGELLVPIHKVKELSTLLLHRDEERRVV